MTVMLRGEARRSYPKRGPVLMEVPVQFAHAIRSLVKTSQEFRHNGLIVTNVGPAGQAATAGMERGDVLLRYNGVELDSAQRLGSLTQRHAEGALASRQVRIEALRGSDEISFDVAGGRLGITVGTPLYRVTRSPKVRTKQRPIEEREGRESASFVVVDAAETAASLEARSRALIEVPADLVRKVVVVLRALEGPARKPKRMARSLLTACSVMPEAR